MNHTRLAAFINHHGVSRKVGWREKGKKHVFFFNLDYLCQTRSPARQSACPPMGPSPTVRRRATASKAAAGLLILSATPWLMNSVMM